MDPGPSVRSERSLRRRSEPAPAFERGPRSRVVPAPKIPHAGRGWSRELCRQHLSRTRSLERHLCVCERPRQCDVRFADGNPHALDHRKLERTIGDLLSDFFEEADVTVCHYFGDQVIDPPVVHNVFRRDLCGAPVDPEGCIDFDRLSDLRLVGQYAYPRVKAHAFERHHIRGFITAATHRAPLLSYV